MGHSLPVCHQCQICQKYVRPCYSKTNIHIGNAGKIIQERVQQQQNTTCCPIINLILSLHDIKNSPLACPGGAGSLSPPAILHLIVASREFIARTPRLRAAAASPWQWCTRYCSTVHCCINPPTHPSGLKYGRGSKHNSLIPQCSVSKIAFALPIHKKRRNLHLQCTMILNIWTVQTLSGSIYTVDYTDYNIIQIITFEQCKFYQGVSTL